MLEFACLECTIWIGREIPALSIAGGILPQMLAALNFADKETRSTQPMHA